MAKIERVSFVDGIERVYRIAAHDVTVPAEVSVCNERIVVVAPHSRWEFDQLVAYAIAEILGAKTDAQMRALSLLVLPLLQCRTQTEMAAYVRRQGIDWRRTAVKADLEGEEDLDGESEQRDDVVDAAIQQIVADLSVNAEPSGTSVVTAAAACPMPAVERAERQQPPNFTLPQLSEIRVTVSECTPSWTAAPSVRRNGNAGAGSFGSAAGTGDEERDRLVGTRGEEIVYQRELERVAALGYKPPEAFVAWVCQENPTADHDIRSIAEDGQPLWIEVKSTTGTDGRFYWPKQEFKKAFCERDHYELCRVYEAHTTHPTIKRFRDPIALVARAALRLEVGTLRAMVEPMTAVEDFRTPETATNCASCSVSTQAESLNESKTTPMRVDLKP